MRESAHSQAGFNATESQRWSQAASEKRDTNWKFCFDAGSPASPGTREEEEGLPVLALLPCVCLHAGLSSAGDPGRGMQQLLSKCRVTCCAQPDRATRGWHGPNPKMAADHPPLDKETHGGWLARPGCYERTASYDRASS